MLCLKTERLENCLGQPYFLPLRGDPADGDPESGLSDPQRGSGAGSTPALCAPCVPSTSLILALPCLSPHSLSDLPASNGNLPVEWLNVGH